MPGSVNLTHYPWLVKSYNLEKNLLLLFPQASTNCILTSTENCRSQSSSKRFHFIGYGKYYRKLHWSKCRDQLTLGCTNPIDTYSPQPLCLKLREYLVRMATKITYFRVPGFPGEIISSISERKATPMKLKILIVQFQHQLTCQCGW